MNWLKLHVLSWIVMASRTATITLMLRIRAIFGKLCAGFFLNLIYNNQNLLSVDGLKWTRNNVFDFPIDWYLYSSKYAIVCLTNLELELIRYPKIWLVPLFRTMWVTIITKPQLIIQPKCQIYLNKLSHNRKTGVFGSNVIVCCYRCVQICALAPILRNMLDTHNYRQYFNLTIWDNEGRNSPPNYYHQIWLLTISRHFHFSVTRAIMSERSERLNHCKAPKISHISAKRVKTRMTFSSHIFSLQKSEISCRIRNWEDNKTRKMNGTD